MAAHDTAQVWHWHVRVETFRHLSWQLHSDRLGHVKKCKVTLFTGKEHYGDSTHNTVTGFMVWSHRISDDLALPCAIVFDGGITLARESETKKDYARDF